MKGQSNGNSNVVSRSSSVNIESFPNARNSVEFYRNRAQGGGRIVHPTTINVGAQRDAAEFIDPNANVPQHRVAWRDERSPHVDDNVESLGTEYLMTADEYEAEMNRRNEDEGYLSQPPRSIESFYGGNYNPGSPIGEWSPMSESVSDQDQLDDVVSVEHIYLNRDELPKAVVNLDYSDSESDGSNGTFPAEPKSTPTVEFPWTTPMDAPVPMDVNDNDENQNEVNVESNTPNNNAHIDFPTVPTTPPEPVQNDDDDDEVLEDNTRKIVLTALHDLRPPTPEYVKVKEPASMHHLIVPSCKKDCRSWLWKSKKK